jgi:O-succinylbenzoate synthase
LRSESPILIGSQGFRKGLDVKISLYIYRLWFNAYYATVASGPFREGALLRIAFPDGCLGYCDCHPWVQLGDAPLRAQLAAAATRGSTPLLTCSYRFARLDAEARAAGRSLFEGLHIPPSHQLLANNDRIEELVQQGITHFKFKCGSHLDMEMEALKNWVHVAPSALFRLDFNEQIPREVFVALWNKIPDSLKERIDFIEDPYPYDPDLWYRDQEHLKVSFAADRASKEAFMHPGSCHAIVIKPAIEPVPDSIPSEAQLVVTTYLDHPLGQMSAAYVAATLKRQFPSRVGFCGLLSHRCYRSDPFIDALDARGPFLRTPQGLGLGFDSLLKELPWQDL